MYKNGPKPQDSSFTMINYKEKENIPFKKLEPKEKIGIFVI